MSFNAAYKIFVCLSIGLLISATALAQDYHLTIDDGNLTLTAEKADIKEILLDLSTEADISIRFPAELQNQITLRLSNVSIPNALKRLLRGEDYAIIYSGSKTGARNAISEVYVLPDRWGDRKPSRAQTRTGRTNTLIDNYNRRLRSLRDRLTRVERGSAVEKRILRQIRSIEKTTERLENAAR